jgi:ATP-dependent RNA helicase SUPV3L1/SUV3
MAHDLAASVPHASEEERAAFVAYVDEESIGKRRLKRALFDTFLTAHRRKTMGAARAARFAEMTSRYPKLLAEAQLEVGPESVQVRAETTFRGKALTTTLSTDARMRLTDLDVPDAALDAPDAATEFLERLHADLARLATAALAAADDALRALEGVVLGPDAARWLGGASAAADRFLALPPRLAAAEAVAIATQHAGEARGEASRAKLAALARRVGALGDTQLTGRSLKRRYREEFGFIGRTLVSNVDVEATLGADDIDTLAAAATDDALGAKVDEVLQGARAALGARVHDQLGSLQRKVRTLPHIELLNAEEILDIVAPFFGGQAGSNVGRALKKRHARSALVAVEERAREAKYQEDVSRLEAHRKEYADPASYYPQARALGRKLVLYVGPTNSGKTWRALNDLASFESGVYLAPLRLLALEGQEELEKRGKPTSFLTGEERDLKEGARFTSSTIEMLNLEREVDAVVIDEVQLLADERRGWAWLAALLGAPAKTVIMTGSPDAVDIVRQLAEYLGEPLTVHECKRYNELRVADAPLRLRDVDSGGCVVCFSRRDVLRIKALFESNSPLKVAVVYGNLSPQVRREEARRFRGGEADVLVATDAIAMGLNLPIKEVTFFTTEKFNGEEVRPLSTSEIRQIGGRAGRYGVAAYGVVNALSTQSLGLVRRALAESPPALTPPFFVAPGPTHVRIIGQVLGTDSLERILTFFERAMEFTDARFSRSNVEELSFLSSFVDSRLPHLPLSQRLTIASAPVDLKSETVLGWFIDHMLPAFLETVEEDEDHDESPLSALFAEVYRFEHEAAGSSEELRDAEDYLKTLTVYAWLAYRFPETFHKLDVCEATREQVNAFIERSLRRDAAKRCAACNVRLPAEHPYRLCDRCHDEGRSAPRQRHERARHHHPRRGTGGGGGAQKPKGRPARRP